MGLDLQRILSFEITFYAAISTFIIFGWFLKKLSKDEKWVAATILLYAGTEICAAVLINLGFHNLWLYNIMLVPQMLVVNYTLLRNLASLRLKLVLAVFVLIILAMHIVNLVGLQGVNNFANFTYIPACVLMAANSFFCLRDKFEIIDELPFDSLISWFALATLIDNVGSMPILSVLGWTTYINNSIAVHMLNIVAWLYALWYFIIIIGVLWIKTSLRSVFYSQ